MTNTQTYVYQSTKPMYSGAELVRAAVAAFSTGLILMGLGIIVGNANDDSLPPCKTEDSTHCYWDADTMGNGQGNDFVDMEAK